MHVIQVNDETGGHVGLSRRRRLEANGRSVRSSARNPGEGGHLREERLSCELSSPGWLVVLEPAWPRRLRRLWRQSLR